MSLINALLRPTFDLLLLPVRDLPPWVGLVLVSLVAAIFVLLVYGRVSNQKGIAAIKDQIAASFFEIRLFNDDMRAILRAQWDLLRNNVRYLGLNLVPLLWMIVPFVLVIAQLQFHYGYEPLEPGEPTVLTVDLQGEPEADAPRPDLELELPAGVRSDSPGVWIPSRSQMAWRIEVDEEAPFELGIDLDGETYTKSLDTRRSIVRRSPERLAAGFLNQLLYPAEPALPKGSPIRAIRIAHEDAAVSILGLELHWLIWFLILSIVFAYALRKRFGVTF